MNDGEVSGDVDRAGEHNWPHIFGQMRNGGSEKENETTTMFAGERISLNKTTNLRTTKEACRLHLIGTLVVNHRRPSKRTPCI